jgi:hypothetical protein
MMEGGGYFKDELCESSPAPASQQASSRETKQADGCRLRHRSQATAAATG